nr:hypothetical protein [Thermocrispum agreste]
MAWLPGSAWCKPTSTRCGRTSARLTWCGRRTRCTTWRIRTEPWPRRTGCSPPGGLLAVVELTRFARFLPPDGPEFRPGLEQRCHAAHQHRQAERLPHIGADWAAKLTAAGFRIEDTTSLTIEVSGAGRPAVGAYALVSLRRLRQAVTGLVPAEDLAALDDLVDQDGPRCVCHRPDLAVRAERMAWAARRP